MTPDGQIRRQILNFMALHVVDWDIKEKLLQPEDARKRARKGLSRSEQLKSLPIIKEVDAENRISSMRQKQNKK